MTNLRYRERRPKPCSVCGTKFTPDPRVGDRQKTCDKPACRAKRKRRSQADWSERNPDYWVERRLRAQAEELEAAAEVPPARGPPAQMRQIPTSFVQDKMGSDGLVILMFLMRLQSRIMQDAIRAVAPKMMEESDGHGCGSAQDKITSPGQGL